MTNHHLAASRLNGQPWPGKGESIYTACGRTVDERDAAPSWKGSVAESWITCPDCRTCLVGR